MARKKESVRPRQNEQQSPRNNKTVFNDVRNWFIPNGELFSNDPFHGNIKWAAVELVSQALIWSWQQTPHVTDAFRQTAEICKQLGMKHVANNYTTFMNALHSYKDCFSFRLRQRFQELAEDIAGRFWRNGDWVLIGFDGSRTTTPRSAANEKAFCAPNYGESNSAKYRKRKSKGMRRKQNEKNK